MFSRSYRTLASVQSAQPLGRQNTEHFLWPKTPLQPSVFTQVSASILPLVCEIDDKLWLTYHGSAAKS